MPETGSTGTAGTGAAATGSGPGHAQPGPASAQAASAASNQPITEDRLVALMDALINKKLEGLTLSSSTPTAAPSAPPASISAFSTPAEIAAHAGTVPAPLPLQFSAGVFVAPSSTPNPLAGKSSVARYPHVSPATLNSVITHQLEFKELYKLCARLTRVAPPSQTLNITASGALNVSDPSVSKVFPDVHALTDSIATYLGICSFIVGSQHVKDGGGFEYMWTITHGAAAFTQLLHQLLPSYTWASIIAYAEQFFLSRRAEMSYGVYSGWMTPDLTLWAFLVPITPGSAASPKTAQSPTQPRPRAPNMPNVPIAQQVCYNFQQGRCPEPCRYGRLHTAAAAAPAAPAGPAKSN